MSTRSQVFAAYQTYLEAFMASDEAAIRDCIQWPCTFLGEGVAQIRDTYPYSPAVLREQKGWASSIGLEIDIVAASATKAHLELRNCQRIRSDGSVIEEVSAFYAFTKTSEGWKIFAMSALEFPS